MPQPTLMLGRRFYKVFAIPQPTLTLGHRFLHSFYNAQAYSKAGMFFGTVFTMPQPTLKLGHCFFKGFTMPQPTARLWHCSLHGFYNAPACFKAGASFFIWFLQCPSSLQSWVIAFCTVFTMPKLLFGVSRWDHDTIHL